MRANTLRDKRAVMVKAIDAEAAQPTVLTLACLRAAALGTCCGRVNATWKAVRRAQACGSPARDGSKPRGVGDKHVSDQDGATRPDCAGEWKEARSPHAVGK